MERLISEKEIKKAHEIYLIKSKPFIEELNNVYSKLTPVIIVTNTEVKVYYKEMEIINELKSHIFNISQEVNADLKNGKFL